MKTLNEICKRCQNEISIAVAVSLRHRLTTAMANDILIINDTGGAGYYHFYVTEDPENKRRGVGKSVQDCKNGIDFLEYELSEDDSLDVLQKMYDETGNQGLKDILSEEIETLRDAARESKGIFVTDSNYGQ